VQKRHEEKQHDAQDERVGDGEVAEAAFHGWGTGVQRWCFASIWLSGLAWLAGRFFTDARGSSCQVNR
jgi:hypothetical protein